PTQGKWLCGVFRFRSGVLNRKVGLERIRSIVGTPSIHSVREMFPALLDLHRWSPTADDLSVDCVRQGHPDYLPKLVKGVADVIEDELDAWISENGGWIGLTVGNCPAGGFLYRPLPDGGQLCDWAVHYTVSP
ncbi:uncharacterized protein LOC131214844, partial [Anopheles bellator]|uniref:uncharacterized protein LOC131214844 n=1 Tax=Anopheles bellator TaxID=139047 RepID=UPI002649D6AE